ncbi:hypothetical protein BGX23_006366 [Mortierella sp. AD031]|nr:hypothetical protein BGX23_006366 [Mortierella sp. AD031]
MVMTFTCAHPTPRSEQVFVTNPKPSTVWQAGTPVTVNWKYLLSDGSIKSDPFDISLRKGDIAANTTAFVRALGTARQGASNYTFDLPADIVNGSDYQIGVGPYTSESFVILGLAAPPTTTTTSSASSTSGSVSTTTASGSPLQPTTSQPGKSAAVTLNKVAATPLALAGTTLILMVVSLAL